MVNDNGISTQSPYLSDNSNAFDKNYHSMLFRPGEPIQARELTQLQYILQEQLGRLASNLFKNGSLIIGDNSFALVHVVPLSIPAVDTSLSNQGYLVLNDLSQLDGQTVTSVTDKTKTFIVKKFENIAGVNYIFLANKSSGAVAPTTKCNVDESFTVVINDVNYYFKTASATVWTDNLIAKFGDSNFDIFNAIAVHVNESIYFIDGYFVRAQAQTIILRDETTVPALFINTKQTCRVGLTVKKTVQTINQDPSLGDPSSGFNNQMAPGADRLKIDLILNQRPWAGWTSDSANDDLQSSFIELFAIQDGLVHNPKKGVEYNILMQLIAERMYDQSGSFTVDPFMLKFASFVDDLTPTDQTPEVSDKFSAILDTGKAYHLGMKFETVTPFKIEMDKARDTETVNDFDTDCRTGMYLIANCSKSLPNINVREKINLVDEAGQVIGHAFVSDIVFNSVGSYRVYIHDIYMTPVGSVTNPRIDDVTTLQRFDGTQFANIDPALGRITIADASHPNPVTVLFGKSLDKSVFPISSLPIEAGSLTASDYRFRQIYEGTSDGLGNLQLTASPSDLFYPFSGASIGTNLEEVLTNYIIIDVTTGTDVAYSGVTITQTATSWNQITIHGLSANRVFKVIATMKRTTETAVETQAIVRKKVLLLNMAVQYPSVSVSGTNTSTYDLPINGNSSVQLNVKDVLRVRKITSNAIDPATSQPLDVTPLFDFDNGQRDHFYDYAKLTYIPNRFATLPQYSSFNASTIIPGNTVKVWVDFFDWQNISEGSPFTVDSYDFSAANATYATLTPSTKVAEELESWFVGYDYDSVPSFTPASTSRTMDLVSCVDFRAGYPMLHDISGSNLVAKYVSSTDNAVVTKNETSKAIGVGLTGSENASTSSPGAFYFTQPHAFESNAVWTATFNQYLNRIDKIVLTKDQDIGVIKGKSAVNPLPPVDPEDALVLWQVNVPAYTFEQVSKWVNGTYRNNQRYTMSDIRSIEQRVNRIEDTISLNLLEQKLNSDQIVDSAGNTMLKTGLFADDFSGTTKLGDTDNPQYHAAIDSGTAELRPETAMTNVGTKYVDYLNDLMSSGANDSLNTTIYDGRIITIRPDRTEKFVEQGYASEAINVNPFNVFRWEGTAKCVPAVDNWADTETKLTVVDTSESFDFDQNFGSWANNLLGAQVNGGHYSGFDQKSGIVWNDIYNTTNTQVSQSGGWFKKKSTTTVTKSSGGGGYSFDSSVQTFIRNPPGGVSVTVEGLKPNTEVNCFFDEKPMTTTPAVVKTDSTGAATFSFNIPNKTFYVGTHTILVIDDIAPIIRDDSTWATVQYFAMGILNTKTGYIIPQKKEIATYTKKSNTFFGIGAFNTKQASSYSATGQDISPWVSQADSMNSQNLCWKDPIAQSFLVPSDTYQNGIVLKSIRVFFKTADANIPITLEIRPSVNGYPSASEVVPFATKVLYPSLGQVTVSDDASAETQFEFAVPVMLPAGEYHIVIRSNSDEYTVWTSVVGQIDVAGNRITQQPYDGVFFKSANNSTWTADQSRDLKMIIDRFVYAPTGTGISNPAKAVLYTIPPADSQNMDMMHVKVQELTHGQTASTTNWVYRASYAIGGNDPVGIPFIQNTTIPFDIRKILLSSQSVPNQNATIPNPDGRVILTCAMVSNDPAITPMLDLQQISVTGIENKIDYHWATELRNHQDELSGAKCRYITKKITLADGLESDSLRISLEANLQEDQAIHVYYRARGILDNTPFNNLGWNEMVLKSGQNFVSNANSLDFTDYTFIPETLDPVTNDPVMTYAGSGQIKDFAIKIVLIANNTAKAPRVRNFRGVAVV